MPYPIGDIYIGDFPITQAFGARSDIYHARYNLKGHNGIDIGCPSLTTVVSAAEGVVSETGFDAGGYGNYIKIVHDGYLTLYAHLNDIQVKKNDHVIAGQLIAHSNNTGFSDAPHLHFGVAPCDKGGIKTDPNNGYSGYIDPMGTLCSWNVKNIKTPTSPQEQINPSITVAPEELSIKSVQANNFLSVVQFGMQNGLGVYLTGVGQSLDLANNPSDHEAAQKVNLWIGSILRENSELKQKPSKTDIFEDPSQFSKSIEKSSVSDKDTIIVTIANVIRDFIFKKS